MSKPTQGQPYFILPGDNLSDIAKAAYGDSRKWRIIWKANSGVLKSGNPNIIAPGEKINIPIDQEIEAVKRDLGVDFLSNKDPDDFSLVINGKEIVSEKASYFSSVDNMADQWSASLYWNPDDEEMYDLLTPGQFLPTKLYLGGAFVTNSVLYNTNTKLAGNRSTAAIKGWTKAADAIDSTIKSNFEENNITLKDRAEQLLEAAGISVLFELKEDEPFKRVTAGKTKKIGDHLMELASQRGALVSSNGNEQVRIFKPQRTAPVCTLEEGTPFLKEVNFDYDGRKRYNIIKAYADSPGRKRKNKKNTKFAIAKDDNVPRTRSMAFAADDTTAADIQRAADWKRSKMIADALTISQPMPSWYDPYGKLWKPDTMVTVKSKTMFLKEGYDLYIRSVGYGFFKSGIGAVLNLVPIEVYTGEPIVEPWIKL